MATGSPRPPNRSLRTTSGSGSSGSGKTGFCPDFVRKFFFAFFASTDLLGPQGHPRMFRYHLIRIQTGKSGFSKIRIFCFFDFLSIKTLQYGCLWTPLDQPKSPVPVLRYLRYFSVLFRYFCNKYTNHKLLHLEGFFYFLNLTIN